MDVNDAQYADNARYGDRVGSPRCVGRHCLWQANILIIQPAVADTDGKRFPPEQASFPAAGGGDDEAGRIIQGKSGLLSRHDRGLIANSLPLRS
jgi:hypothetical protein